jgi:hypothetical protein
VVVFDRPDADTLQAAHGMTDSLEHPPHLAVASFGNHDRHDRFVAGALLDLAQDAHRCRSRALAVERDASAKALERALVRHAADADLIFASDAVPRMRQPRRELAVARQQQQPF